MKYIKILMAVILIMSASLASAGSIYITKKIDDIYTGYNTGDIYVDPVGSTDHPICSGDLYYIDAATTDERAILATLLTAAATSKDVRFRLDDSSCHNFFPKVIMIILK